MIKNLKTRGSLFVCILLIFFCVDMVHADIFKWIRIGRMWDCIFDSGDQTRPLGSYRQTYYNSSVWAENRAWRIGVKDWTDENGKLWAYKTSGMSIYNCDELFDNMPMEVEDFTIKRYVRFAPPDVKIQGVNYAPIFPQEGDIVDPDYIDAAGAPGADQLVESWIRTSVGIVIHQKVFAFSQDNHDDYIIYDWTFENATGPYTTPGGTFVDLPEQPLKGVYFALEAWLNADGSSYGWSTNYGEREGDSLKIAYNYPAWDNTDYDSYGDPNQTTGFLQEPHYCGWGVLHVDKSVNDTSNDPDQPRAYATGLQKFTTSQQHDQYDPTVCELEYSTFEYGFPALSEGQKAYYFGLEVGASDRTLHQLRMDERKIKFVRDATKGRGAVYLVMGPWDMEPGEDFRIVYCVAGGGLCFEKRWEIGRAWMNGTCTWEGEDKIPPTGKDFPELISTENDRAKDNWVSTGKDSLFRNVWAAKWNMNNNYNVPKAPPPPSVEVWGRPDKIDIKWGNESESAPDFAGYRVYRAVGTPDTTFVKVFETLGSGVHQWQDRDAVRGFSYYYYVTAFDDGSMNQPGVEDGITPGKSVESGRYYNRTTEPVSLTRAGGETLDDIRVVPNPYNIAAAEAGLQYPGENDKIVFMGLPPECTIRIFTQSGDLVKTLEHVDGSGDEPWDDLTTESRQIIVSGIYIAHIETPEGEQSFVKFAIVR
ncbi:hypothetical protein GF406_25910 [candidate division KSB1 bacterium]|nr:hypothetical protein [candidate division KSB1 bacterium]